MTIETVINNLGEQLTSKYNVKEIFGDNVALLHSTNFGDLPVWMVLSESSITFKTKLTDVNPETEALATKSLMYAMASNDFPQSSFGIEENDGVEEYVILGVLSNDSKPEVIIQEVDILSANAIDVMETFFQQI